jgi:chaperonin GroEL (HSP60 family)
VVASLLAAGVSARHQRSGEAAGRVATVGVEGPNPFAAPTIPTG